MGLEGSALSYPFAGVQVLERVKEIRDLCLLSDWGLGKSVRPKREPHILYGPRMLGKHLKILLTGEHKAKEVD